MWGRTARFGTHLDSDLGLFRHRCALDQIGGVHHFLPCRGRGRRALRAASGRIECSDRCDLRAGALVNKLPALSAYSGSAAEELSLRLRDFALPTALRGLR